MRAVAAETSVACWSAPEFFADEESDGEETYDYEHEAEEPPESESEAEERIHFERSCGESGAEDLFRGDSYPVIDTTDPGEKDVIEREDERLVEREKYTKTER